MPRDSSIVIEHVHPHLHLDEQPLRTLIRHVLAEEGGILDALTVVLADHDTVLTLNRSYLDHDYITDVLAFDLSDTSNNHIDGEIYVDLDTAAERHDEFGATFEEEASRYVVHGLLHLLGHDDSHPEGKAAMRRLENEYLTAVR